MIGLTPQDQALRATLTSDITALLIRYCAQCGVQYDVGMLPTLTDVAWNCADDFVWLTTRLRTPETVSDRVAAYHV